MITTFSRGLLCERSEGQPVGSEDISRGLAKGGFHHP